MIYLEQMYINTVEFCRQFLLTILKWTNITSVVSQRGKFLPFLYLVIVFAVLSSSFIV